MSRKWKVVHCKNADSGKTTTLNGVSHDTVREEFTLILHSYTVSNITPHNLLCRKSARSYSTVHNLS